MPRNVHVIGTMNTADRSIALLDAALRRHFGFNELMPYASSLHGAFAGVIPVGPWLSALNRRVCEHVGRDARNLHIGHAYFFERNRPVSSFQQFARIVREDVIPLLQDYCYEDYDAHERVLWKGLIDAPGQRVRFQIFENEAELTQALLTPCPEIVTTTATVAEIVAAADEDPDDVATTIEGAEDGDPD